MAIKFLERGPGVNKSVLREILNHRLCVVHPNIVQFREIFLTPVHLAIVMEFAAGGDMFEFVIKHKLPQHGQARGSTSRARARSKVEVWAHVLWLGAAHAKETGDEPSSVAVLAGQPIRRDGPLSPQGRVHSHLTGSAWPEAAALLHTGPAGGHGARVLPAAHDCARVLP